MKLHIQCCVMWCSLSLTCVAGQCEAGFQTDGGCRDTSGEGQAWRYVYVGTKYYSGKHSREKPFTDQYSYRKWAKLRKGGLLWVALKLQKLISKNLFSPLNISCYYGTSHCLLPADIVNKDQYLKSTLRVLYSIFGKYKYHFQQQPHPQTTPTSQGNTSAV